MLTSWKWEAQGSKNEELDRRNLRNFKEERKRKRSCEMKIKEPEKTVSVGIEMIVRRQSKRMKHFLWLSVSLHVYVGTSMMWTWVQLSEHLLRLQCDEQCAKQKGTQRWISQSLFSRTLACLGGGRQRVVVEGSDPIPGQPAAIRDACNSWGGLVSLKLRRFVEWKPHHLGASLAAHITLGAGSPFLPADSAPPFHLPWVLTKSRFSPTVSTCPIVSANNSLTLWWFLATCFLGCICPGPCCSQGSSCVWTLWCDLLRIFLHLRFLFQFKKGPAW